MQRPRSQSSIYDIFPAQRDFTKPRHNKSHPYQEMAGDPHRKYSEIKGFLELNQSPYVTSEKYHALNKVTSDKSVVRSTSTLFYDLDNLAKRHSYHCVAGFSISTSNILNMNPNNNHMKNSGFDAKSNAIVQECATENQPKIKAKDSISVNSRKAKRILQSNLMLSSDMFINTELKEKDMNHSHELYEKEQKFWSFAKYHTEYTKPQPEEKRNKNKNHTKQTEDPCPCQLFSYACPCADKKSLTNLAKNSKIAAVANQVTSTMKISISQRNKNFSVPKEDSAKVTVDKVVNAKATEELPEYNIVRVSDQVSPPSMYQSNVSKHHCNENKTRSSSKQKNMKKPRQVTCPRCKERIDVLSFTEEEECLNFSTINRMKDNPSPGQCSYSSSLSQRSKHDGDICNHDPPCEMVPVCQILPSEQAFMNSTKCFKMESKMKNTAKTIKITKACRHHPPCTVVPSCQRMRVLSNNCEFIPPCIHRPRCVNLPLCVPFSKTIDYDELLNRSANEEDNNVKCHHSNIYTTPTYVPFYQRDSINNNIEHHFCATHNTCEFVNDYEPRFFINPKRQASPILTSYQTSSPVSCSCPKPNKSCQYECDDCKCRNNYIPIKSESGDVIVYIRDVGCQFRSKQSPCDNSLRSKMSCPSFQEDPKVDNYFSNYHTLRYEDKFTNPISGGDQTVSSSSIEIDIHCPSHGRDKKQVLSELNTGFKPRASPVVANCSLHDPIVEYCMTTCKEDIEKKRKKSHSILNTVTSRKSFLKGKHKKLPSVRRRRKSRLSYQSLLNSSSMKSYTGERAT
ncbi:unnamed protein product [Leptosia nina]|uniref:Uncharacterized protein n=1 Tax=Leptosia nina TaxID=320188 RepID=A0AAV1J938_9NEOP